MPHSTATIETPNASRYLQQLCKHFGHKVPVDYTTEAGSITLPFGTCALAASDTALALDASGQDLARIEQVIGDHLMRFAFREAPALAWHRNTI